MLFRSAVLLFLLLAVYFAVLQCKRAYIEYVGVYRVRRNLDRESRPGRFGPPSPRSFAAAYLLPPAASELKRILRALLYERTLFKFKEDTLDLTQRSAIQPLATSACVRFDSLIGGSGAQSPLFPCIVLNTICPA